MLTFRTLSKELRVQGGEEPLIGYVKALYGAMLASKPSRGSPDLALRMSARAGRWSLSRGIDAEPIVEGDADEILFALDKEFVVELQRLRPDLLFLHAAVLGYGNEAIVLAADTGQGKSTTTWALLHHGFDYLSDELAPIDVDSLQVHSYPRAVCLKKVPPDPYALPANCLKVGHRLHIPTQSLPAATTLEPRPIRAIFLLAHEPAAARTTVASLSPAEAGARLYVTALNALAHSGRGVDAALALAQRVPCYSLVTAGLPDVAARVKSSIAAA